MQSLLSRLVASAASAALIAAVCLLISPARVAAAPQDEPIIPEPPLEAEIAPPDLEGPELPETAEGPEVVPEPPLPIVPPQELDGPAEQPEMEPEPPIPPAPSPSDVDPSTLPPVEEPPPVDEPPPVEDELPEPVPSVPDRFLQGEYAGPICLHQGADGWVYDYAGLQVVDLGEGNFAGVFYPGGLPGTGWSRRERVSLSGTRSGDQIELTGGDLRATIRLGQSLIETTGGRPLGSLRRVLRHSATLGRPAPPGAIILFDGSHTDHFRNGAINQEGNLQAGADLKERYRDFTLHVEFRLPYEPGDRSQGRGNSGIYLQSRYEVQILDSFGLEPAFNEAGALYRLRSPEVNMSLPPYRWQTYDIAFRSPRFDAQGRKIQDARITVLHNNVLIHENVAIPRKTGAGQPEGPELLPIRLQDHGDPVEFRNIWIVDYSHLSDAPVWSPPWGNCIGIPYFLH